MKPLLRILKTRVYLAISVAMILASLCTFIIVGCSNFDSASSVKKQYEELLSSPMNKLLERGEAHYKAGNLDSAYLAYMAVTSRYDENMKAEEKLLCERAFNNAAYISHILYYDYPQTYSLLLNGLEIAEDIDNDAVKANIYINIGNLMCATGNWDEGMSYQQKALKAAIDTADTVNYLKGATNLFVEAILENKIENFQGEVEKFPVLKGVGSLYNYAETVSKVAKSKLTGDYKAMAYHLEELSAQDDSNIAPRERMIFFRHFIWAKTLEQRGLTKEALSTLKSIESLNIAEPELRSYMYGALADNYKKAGMSDSAAEYKLRFAELGDTLRSDKKQLSIYEMKQAYENRTANFRMSSLMEEHRVLVRTIWIVSGFSVVILALLVWVFISRRNVIRAKREIYERNQELLTHMDESECETMPTKPVGETNPVDTELLEPIKEEMRSNPEVYNCGYSEECLAGNISAPVKKVSETIKDGLKQNFSTTLQSYRIREACRRLTDTEHYEKMTIEAISESVGFKSRSNFNAVFKKLTGLTPAVWQKIARSKTRS
ncbi:MAG: helix-turn-helix domain-containing protein [Prevotella sp.]|nr:helix-turn-helix domain-containing protein [Prevotella sp.]MCM1075244.1 helix-turn-helix domain-containing protein [Ruminococcus sp.]